MGGLCQGSVNTVLTRRKQGWRKTGRTWERAGSWALGQSMLGAENAPEIAVGHVEKFLLGVEQKKDFCFPPHSFWVDFASRVAWEAVLRSGYELLSLVSALGMLLSVLRNTVSWICTLLQAAVLCDGVL